MAMSSASESNNVPSTDMSVMPPTSSGGSFSLNDIKASADWAKRTEPNMALKGKKYAIAFGYCGSNYQGLQVNPEALTIEALLERALLLSGLIDETKFADLHALSWTRAARTDKGVHALGQCVAAKLLLTDGDMVPVVARINQFLPSDIRVFHLSRVSKNFNAKNACFGRRYHYILPTYACGDKKELERLITRVVVGDPNADAVDPRINADGTMYKGGTKAENAVALATGAAVGSTESQKVAKLFSDLEPEQYQQIAEEARLKDFRISPEKLALLRTALKSYQGTHSYHNFTYHKASSDASASRYIISFIAEEPFVDPISGLEWVCLQVEGQSFLLNQIRKMVAMAIEVARGGVPLETITAAFAPGKMDLPIAPGIGLYLNELLFNKYNRNVIFENEKQALIRKKALKAKQAVAAKTAPPVVPTAAATVTDAVSADATSKEEDPPAKKLRLDDEGNAAASTEAEASTSTSSISSSSAVVMPPVAPVTIPATAAGDDNDDENAEKETLDWLSKPQLRPIISGFKESAVWSHVFREEARNCDMLRYLHYTSFIAPRDFATRPEK